MRPAAARALAFRTLLVAVTAISVFHLPGAAAQQFTLKYGHVDTPSDKADDHVAGLFLKAFLEARSQGRIKVEIYPASQLGNFRELIEGVQLGTLELANTTVGGANSFMPQIQVTDIPYMYRDDLVAEKMAKSAFFDDVRDEFLKRTKNVRLAAVGNTGRWRSFYTTKKQIKTASDLAGVKMRTINSPLQIEMVKFLGGNPTPIAWGELYTSLATGVAEGTKNGLSDVVGKKLHEHLKYVVLDEHAYLFNFWWLSESWYQGLPDDLKVLVIDGITQASELQTQVNKYLETILTDDFIAAGGTIYAPTAEEKKTFQTAKPAMRDWFVQNIEDGQLWYDKLEAAVKQAEAEVDAERGRIAD
jgi:tripartite ATP-independent transporter DctP family solute receptor